MTSETVKLTTLAVVEARPPAFSDEALALEFAALHANDLRYVAVWGKWLKWDGTRWKRDTTLHAYDLARAVCREASERCNSPSIAKAIASASTVAAVERLAKADRLLAATTEQWDCDPWLLNTPDGTIDLSTGQMREHRREDYCTKITAVGPGGECPLWLSFLNRIMRNDEEVIRFLCRIAGLALTGLTRDHALFFLYGEGGNGKGVFIDSVAGVLGDYAQTAPIETFLAASFDKHPTELARLCGARLVTASEPDENRYWSESRIKLLTGGDRIAARFMHQDFFEYDPLFKLVISGNSRPSFRRINNAIRRRLHMVPFNVTIPAGEVDDSLPEKLREEWPGILAWMIGGCLEWQSIGLAPPPAVREASEGYLSEEDTFGHWIDECCHRSSTGWTNTTELYASWSRHARDAGEEPGSLKFFVQQMEDRGFTKRRTGSARGFDGIILRR